MPYGAPVLMLEPFLLQLVEQAQLHVHKLIC